MAQHWPRRMSRLRAFEDCLAILSHEDMTRADAQGVLRALAGFKSFCLDDLDPKPKPAEKPETEESK